MTTSEQMDMFEESLRRLGHVVAVIAFLALMLVILISVEFGLLVKSVCEKPKKSRVKGKSKGPDSVVVKSRKSKSSTSKKSRSEQSSKPRPKKTKTKEYEHKMVGPFLQTALPIVYDEKPKTSGKPREAVKRQVVVQKEEDPTAGTKTAEEISPPLITKPTQSATSFPSISSVNSSVLGSKTSQSSVGPAAKPKAQEQVATPLKTAIEMPVASKSPLGPNGETTPAAQPPRAVSPANSLMMDEKKMRPIEGPPAAPPNSADNTGVAK